MRSRLMAVSNEVAEAKVHESILSSEDIKHGLNSRGITCDRDLSHLLPEHQQLSLHDVYCLAGGKQLNDRIVDFEVCHFISYLCVTLLNAMVL